MKTVALIILAIVCAATGQCIADSYKKRVLLLEKTEILISVIRDEISFYALPVSELIHLLSKKDTLKQLKFISECSRHLTAGCDFPQAWTNALDDRKNIAFLKKKDVELLKSFGENFGVTDSEGQLSNCNVCLELLKINHNEALKDKERYSYLSTGIGFLAGLGIMIVLI